MDAVKKCMILSGVAGMIGAAGMLLIVKGMHPRPDPGIGEKTGKTIDEKLKASMGALERATAHFHSVIERVTNRKP